MINRLQETNQPVAVQETTFSVDVMGRFICNTWDEAATGALLSMRSWLVQGCSAHMRRKDFIGAAGLRG
jgi:hypothetical protein